MGLSAGLFYSATADEKTLYTRIRPTDDQFDRQQTYWNELAEFLKEDLAQPNIPIRSWLQGSYKFGTQIRPSDKDGEFDIDLGIYFEIAGDPTSSELQPAELKNSVQQSLLRYKEHLNNDSTEVDEPSKERCCRIHYAKEFHIDVPCYILDTQTDTRILATQSNNWEYSDPKSIYVWWKSQFEGNERALARRLVCYLKMWAALNIEKAERPSSIMLTVLMANALNKLNANPNIPVISGDDEWFAFIIGAILQEFRENNYQVQNPIDNAEDLNRLNYLQNVSLEAHFSGLFDLVQKAYSSTNIIQSAAVWSEIFSHFFPNPESNSRAITTWVPSFDPTVQIIVRDKRSGQIILNSLNNVAQVPKQCDIEFTITNANLLPPGAEVKWMVRNSDVGEADAENDLGHEVGSGITFTRDSAYHGTHFMDITVFLNEEVIGTRRVHVGIIGIARPLRNPRRPAWTRLRARR